MSYWLDVKHLRACSGPGTRILNLADRKRGCFDGVTKSRFGDRWQLEMTVVLHRWSGFYSWQSVCTSAIPLELAHHCIFRHLHNDLSWSSDYMPGSVVELWNIKRKRDLLSLKEITHQLIKKRHVNKSLQLQNRKALREVHTNVEKRERRKIIIFFLGKGGRHT